MGLWETDKRTFFPIGDGLRVTAGVSANAICTRLAAPT